MRLSKFFGLMAFAGLALAACNDDDEQKLVIGPQEPVVGNAFILGTGNEGYGINGEMASFDATLKTVVGGLFETANGRMLGLTPNDMAIDFKRSELCFAVTTSNVIEFADKNTLRSTAHIELADSSFGGPRRVVVSGDHAYVTMNTGHVVRVATATHTIDGVAAFQALEGSYVGTYPEGLAVKDGKIYVALSGQGDQIEKRVAVVDAASMEVDGYIGVVPNTVDVFFCGEQMYVLSSGWYDAQNNYAQKGAGLYKIKHGGQAAELMCEATAVAQYEDKFYYLDAPYGASTTQMGYFTTTDETCTTLATPAPGATPTAFGVSMDGRYLLIGSYQMGEYGYADYQAPGYVVHYDLATGQTTDCATDVYGINRFIFF